MKVGELKKLLMNSVAQGQCDHVPQSVLSLRQSMEQALHPLHEKWQQDVQEWDTNDRRKILEELNKCKTPGEKANYDLDLFPEHYFTTNGHPDHHKTRDPLSLEGFDDRLGLHLKAGEVPGLYTKRGGPKDNRTLCIGWDTKAVDALAASINTRAREAEKHEKEMKGTQAMEAHELFVSTLKPPPPSRGRKANPSFDLEKCQGSYIVKCDPVTDGDGNSLRANFDFGIVTGAMFLPNDKETLDDLVESDDGSGTEDSEDSEDEEETKKGRKRSIKKETKGANKGRPAKKKKSVTPLSRRVFYRLRGKETSEGEILPDAEAGEIDFLSDDCTKFSGVAYEFPYVDSSVEFSGYKISNTPKGFPRNWNDYSEAAYERARIGRWR
ncbi:hypothetical protein FPHYL_3711 [Fusarium phyllophilum]|uniref:Uncharacterized protein n=1 Tax=Fusarium phyllophilum TaxID=47803 RepID=A0A8H5NIJ6_9HYPO|nr:hypothetical protein FPHYL_3711 [Fusarium phyllophilum]